MDSFKNKDKSKNYLGN